MCPGHWTWAFYLSASKSGDSRFGMTLATASPDCGHRLQTWPGSGIRFGENVMGIFDALNTAVSGLQSQSFALQNISGNIANASTTGYKGIGSSFEDLIPN